MDYKSHKEIYKKGKWVFLEDNSNLFNYGEKSDSFYLLVTGLLKAYIPKKGELIEVGEIYEGEVIGEMGILTNEARSASIFATRDSVVFKIDLEKANEIISNLGDDNVMFISTDIMQEEPVVNAVNSINDKNFYYLAHDLEYLKNLNVHAIVVINPKDLSNKNINKLNASESFKKILPPCFGGNERCLSVRKGLETISKLKDNPSKVLIHDGARPLVSKKIIKKVINKLIKKYPSNPYFYELKAQMLRENGFLKESEPFNGLIPTREESHEHE